MRLHQRSKGFSYHFCCVVVSCFLKKSLEVMCKSAQVIYKSLEVMCKSCAIQCESHKCHLQVICKSFASHLQVYASHVKVICKWLEFKYSCMQVIGTLRKVMQKSVQVFASQFKSVNAAFKESKSFQSCFKQILAMSFFVFKQPCWQWLNSFAHCVLQKLCILEKNTAAAVSCRKLLTRKRQF